MTSVEPSSPPVTGFHQDSSHKMKEFRLEIIRSEKKMEKIPIPKMEKNKFLVCDEPASLGWCFGGGGS